MLTGGAARVLAEAYGTWLGIACAVALVVLESARMRMPIRRPGAVSLWPSLRAGAAVLLLVGLFLPWLEYDLPHGLAFGYSGWQVLIGTAAGALALLLLTASALRWVESYAPEATLAIALLVATPGVMVALISPSARLGSGAYVDFVAAAVLLVVATRDFRLERFERRQAVVRSVAVLASAACAAAVVVSTWEGVLPFSWLFEATPAHGWFAMVVLVLMLHLFCRWLAQRTPSRWLVLVPVVAGSLSALDLIGYRDFTILWGGVIVVGLSLLLALLGWIENGGDPRKLPLPELLRVDRLPEVEG